MFDRDTVVRPDVVVRALTGITLFALAASPGLAQVLDEIVVTAQKREQSIQDVGIAITAFTGDQLDRLGIVESTEVTSLTPGVHFSAFTAGQSKQFTIRGVTQNDFSEHAETPNAVYLDEGYLASPQTQLFAAFDLERVEILKGPQGTLFGRNATGGLVHYITRKPTEEFEGYADITYGRYDRIRAEGAVSGPLAANVQGRLSGIYNRHDPIIENTFPFGDPTNPAEAFGGPAWFGSPSGAEDAWRDDHWAFRAQVQWQISDRAELLLSGNGADQSLGSGHYQGEGTTPVINELTGGHVNSIFAQDEPRGCEAISLQTGNCLPIVLLDGEFFGPGNPVFGPEDALRPVPGGDLFGYIDPDDEGFTTSTDHVTKDFNILKSWSGTGKLTWEFDKFLLTTVSHYMYSRKRTSLDVDSSPHAGLNVMSDQNTDTFSQEVRINGELERARWVAGFYYLWISAGYNQGLANSPGGPFTTTLFPLIFGGFDPVAAQAFLPGGAAGLPALEANTLADLITNSYSVFGQVDFDLTNKLTFIAGLRTIIEDKDMEWTNNYYANFDDRLTETDVLIAPGYAPFEDKTSDTLWTGKLEMDYRPTEDWLVYVSLSRGVKAGSFNAPLNDGSPRLSDDQIGYDEEVLYAYEIGFKSTLFGGTTRFNGSFYYYDYQDYQAFLFQGSSGAIFNNDAKYKGIELEVQTRPIEGLDFLFNASFIDAEVTNLAVSPGVFRDVTPSFTPQAQLGGVLRYEFPLVAFGGTLAAQMDANYASNAYHNIRNYQTQKMDAYVVGNARLSWISPDGAWELSAFVKNLADERYKVTGFDLSTLCGCSEEGWGRPREWGVRLRYNFDADSW
jgi:iron complex outermembrane receptor protein